MNLNEFIFEHFGQDNQIEKLREEVEEFIEAVITGDVEHITEEYADIIVVLHQFKEAYDLEDCDIKEKMLEKQLRTVKRIHNGYYKRSV